MNDELIITAADLTLQDVVDVARNDRNVSISPALSAQFDTTRAYISEHWMHDEAPLIYSLNTGVGAFKDRRVEVSDIEQYQRNMILSHATGLGESFARDIVRATLLLRLNAFSADVSGISPVLAQRFADFLNAGLIPVMPCKGQRLHGSEEFFQGHHPQNARAAERRIVHGVRAGGGSRVGCGRPLSRFESPPLHGQHRLHTRGGPGCRHELPRVLDALDVQEDGVGAGIIGEKVQHVAKVHVQHVPEGYEVGETHGPWLGPILDGGDDRA